MKFKQILIACVALAGAGASWADLALAQKHACIACHAVDKKMVGPSYKDVAAKYAKDKDAVTKLAASIKAGGTGKWGQVPMPAQTSLSDADAKTLASWIMSIK